MSDTRYARQGYDLERTFSASRMQRVWKKTVHRGLRQQHIQDLHDYLDIHRSIRTYVHHLRAEVLAGRYRPQAPEVIRLEKRDGISRRILLPSPGDALVLQTLVEVFEPTIKERQPTRNAYYSRSHDGPQVEEINGEFGYTWWQLWPEFQKRLFQFSQDKPYIVVADIANYFDSIPLSSLRNLLSSMGQFSEELLDFLFYMLEAFTWRPHYMPMSGVGLPQVDFDAPRLLAHAYLYKADEELRSAVGDNFVRWMDDIDIGVDSPNEGRRVLGRIEYLLNSNGLRLNSGKTKILDAEQAADHFWVEENLCLNPIQNTLRNESASIAGSVLAHRILLQRYKQFRLQPHRGNWEKVQKRYLTLFGLLGDTVLENEISQWLEDYPALRRPAFRYFTALGYSASRYNIIEDYLTSGKCIDDSSIYLAIRALVDWRIPFASEAHHSIASLASRVVVACDRSVAAVTGGLWLVAKYGSSLEVEQFITDTYPVWRQSHWAGRQVAAATPRLSPNAYSKVKSKLLSSGLRDGISVLAHFDELRGLTALDPQLRSYLFAKPQRGSYPLGKVLIAIALLDCQSAAEERLEMRQSIAEICHDEVYSSLLGLPRVVVPISTTPRAAVSA